MLSSPVQACCIYHRLLHFSLTECSAAISPSHKHSMIHCKSQRCTTEHGTTSEEFNIVQRSADWSQWFWTQAFSTMPWIMERIQEKGNKGEKGFFRNENNRGNLNCTFSKVQTISASNLLDIPGRKFIVFEIPFELTQSSVIMQTHTNLSKPVK